MYKALFTRSFNGAKTALANNAQTRGIVNINRVVLLGNVGSDPSETSFSNGKKIASFPLATSRRYKDGEGNLVEQTYWHQVRVNGASADVALNLIKKGCLVEIVGGLRYDTFTNKDNIEVHKTTIVADKFVVHRFPKRKESEEQTSTEDEE